jgi:(2R)-ethylmalonyl-CoA mutase
MESGAGPAEEIGFAFGNALMILDAIRPTLAPAAFEQTVRRISFFINSGIELVPEICKVRAYFKLWRELCRDEYGIGGVAFRAGCQVRSLTLTEQQPEVNIIRIAYEALPVVLSSEARVNALQLPGFREALALPDEAEQLIGLRTQQVLMHETEIGAYGDIFTGSTIIEKLTEETAENARRIAIGLRETGYAGAIAAVSAQLTRLLAERQRRIEAGEIVQIGVNAFAGEIGLTPASSTEDDRDYAAVAREQITALNEWRAARDNRAVAAAREKLARTLSENGPTMEPTLELAGAGGTVGEWTSTIEAATNGRYVPPILDRGAPLGKFDLPSADRRIRIALGKAGLDGHINAVKLLAQACMQAGMEVILVGFKQTPTQLVEAAVQEDAEILAISSLAGAHMAIAREAIALLNRSGAGHVKLVMGGIVPEKDRQQLLDLGVRAVFTPKDSNLGAIIARLIALSAET